MQSPGIENHSIENHGIESHPLNALNVLAVDDEVFNLEILSEWLTDWGVNIDTTDNGEQALSLMDTGERHYHLLLLDRMMPGMDGFKFLQTLRQRPQYKDMPVIMQSASATVDEIQYAFAQGVWYYLCKPFERRKLYSIIEAAMRDVTIHTHLRELVNESSFQPKPPANEIPVLEVKTLSEVCDVAVKLAQISDEPEKVVVGLYELLLNAVEHGNLEISYNEKTRLLNNHAWNEEIDARLNRSPYCDRRASIAVSALDAGLQYRIIDQGAGFRSDSYLQLQTYRAGDNHGRGIAIAKNCSFGRLEYRGCGNEVLAFTGKTAHEVAK
jgi:CheY-like chemotaxis protein